jgi:hypothetical protein
MRALGNFLGILGAILVLGTIAAPNFIHMHCRTPTKTCIANLKQMDSAKEQYAMDHHLKDGDPIPSGILWAPDQYIKSEPECPNGGVYTIDHVGDLPTCSFNADHSLAKAYGVGEVIERTHRRDCDSNLRELLSAKKQYARDHHLRRKQELPAGCLWGAHGLLREKPVCPCDGRYTIGLVGEMPTCSSVNGHWLN